MTRTIIDLVGFCAVLLVLVAVWADGRKRPGVSIPAVPGRSYSNMEAVWLWQRMDQIHTILTTRKDRQAALTLVSIEEVVRKTLEGAPWTASKETVAVRDIDDGDEKLALNQRLRSAIEEAWSDWYDVDGALGKVMKTLDDGGYVITKKEAE